MLNRRRLLGGALAAPFARPIGTWLIGGTTTLAAAGCGAPATGPSLPRFDILVPSSPGGGWDQTARSMERALVASGLAEGVRVSHAPGGGGAIGLARFLANPGNDQALMVTGLVMLGALLANATPLSLADATPLARLTGEYEVVAVHRDSPLTDMTALVSQLQADPGSVSWAGGAAGGTDHLLVAMIAEAAGIDPRAAAYVAYAGGGLAQTALLGNQVTCAVSGLGELAPQLEAGQLRALAISAPAPLPGIAAPTLHDAGLAIDLVNWRAVFGAPGLDDAAQAALTEGLKAMVATPAWAGECVRYGWTDLFLSGPALGNWLADENARIAALVKRLGLTA